MLREETLDNRLSFFEDNGTGGAYPRTNTEALAAWLQKLGQSKVDKQPIVWIRQMLQEQPNDRITASSLLNQILEYGDDHVYYGSCCNAYDDSEDGTSYQGSVFEEDPSNTGNVEKDKETVSQPLLQLLEPTPISHAIPSSLDSHASFSTNAPNVSAPLRRPTSTSNIRDASSLPSLAPNNIYSENVVPGFASLSIRAPSTDARQNPYQLSPDLTADEEFGQLFQAADRGINLTAEEKKVFGQLFQAADTDNIGIITGEVAVKFFEKTRLEPRILGEVRFFIYYTTSDRRSLLTAASL